MVVKFLTIILYAKSAAGIFVDSLNWNKSPAINLYLSQL
jgi:hypothetical protein